MAVRPSLCRGGWVGTVETLVVRGFEAGGVETFCWEALDSKRPRVPVVGRRLAVAKSPGASTFARSSALPPPSWAAEPVLPRPSPKIYGGVIIP